jgi:hypothetical protein
MCSLEKIVAQHAKNLSRSKLLLYVLRVEFLYNFPHRLLYL